MQITNLDELRAYLRGGFSGGWVSVPLFVASREFDALEEINFGAEPVIGGSLMDDENTSHPYVGLYWVGDNGHLWQRSTKDMNIPENHYNDWRCFTTKEEAEAHRNPIVKLEISAEAAAILLFVCSNVGGDPKGSRGKIDEVIRALHKQNVEPNRVPLQPGAAKFYFAD